MHSIIQLHFQSEQLILPVGWLFAFVCVIYLARLTGPLHSSEERSRGGSEARRRHGSPSRPAVETSPTLGTTSQTVHSGCDTSPPDLAPLTEPKD